MSNCNMWEIEQSYFDSGVQIVCGVDEAGRGPLCGPVVAAACILPPDFILEGLNDSKKLTAKKRDALFDVILEVADDYCVASAMEKEIDELNILQATFLAMNRAFDGLREKPDLALVDGNRNPGVDAVVETVVKGDARSMSIAAASILAKVSRDRYMLEIAKLFPQYQFEKHKWYGTKLHYEMLQQYGVSEVHRLSFLKNLEEHFH